MVHSPYALKIWSDNFTPITTYDISLICRCVDIISLLYHFVIREHMCVCKRATIACVFVMTVMSNEHFLCLFPRVLDQILVKKYEVILCTDTIAATKPVR